MTDDDLLNLILGSNPNGPSATQFAKSATGIGETPANSGGE